MPKMNATRGAVLGTGIVPAAAAPVNVPGSPNELRVLAFAARQWPESKESRKQWDLEIARSEYMTAANTVRAPRVLGSWRTTYAALLADLTGIAISFEGTATKYGWGGLLGTVNSAPFSAYFGATQASDSIVPRGSDPYVPASGYQGTWGYVVLNILDIGYSSRFGGSFCVTLAPSEDCGIELQDVTKKIAVDLYRWVIKLYVRAAASVFNQPPNPYTGVTSLLQLCASDIEVYESEAYEIGAGGTLIANSPNVSQGDVQALIRRAEGDAVPRLEKLARFVLGWVHEANIPAFNRTSQSVARLHVSDGSCEFELSSKSATIACRLKVGYLFSSEGLFDDERELTARPWMILRDSLSQVILSHKHKKYIGNAQGTGWVTMGYITPSDLADVVEITVFPGWTEDDLISDDEGGAVASVFNVAFDAAAITQRVAALQPGPIGQDVFALANDPLLEWTSYSFEIEFVLEWR